MNFLYKLIFIFLSITLMAGAVFAVSFDNITLKTFRAPENKVAYEYFESYSKQLFDAFEPKKLGLPVGSGTEILYVLNRDASISDIQLLWSFKPTDKDVIYVIDMLKKNSPKPFPKEIEDQNIRVDIFLYKSTENVIKMDYHDDGDVFSSRGTISMHIGKNSKIKNPTAPTPQMHFPHLKDMMP
ncbi:MAG: hypothetical protein PHX18_00225 [Candidatus Gastranaerophilales bacterium]|nr:hypothetical protein [Candidatus Gastranaerophilales bacterium]